MEAKLGAEKAAPYTFFFFFFQRLFLGGEGEQKTRRPAPRGCWVRGCCVHVVVVVVGAHVSGLDGVRVRFREEEGCARHLGSVQSR